MKDKKIIHSKAPAVNYVFAQACPHDNDLIGEGVHISFTMSGSNLNIFLDSRNAINFYLSLERAINTLEKDGRDVTKSIIKDKKQYEKSMMDWIKTQNP